jgi:excisionase family DNA binding protein
MSGLQLSQSPSKAFLGVEEFAQATGLSEQTVRRYLKKNRLPFVQPAGKRGRILIPFTALKFLESGPSSPEPTPAIDRAAPETKSTNPDGFSRERLPGPKPRWARGPGRS